jgi:hypothetical protein
LHIRDNLDVLIGHLEDDMLPPRVVAASAQHLMSVNIAGPAFAPFSVQTHADWEGRDDNRRGR